MSNETYSIIDQLSNKAKAMFGNDNGTPSMLNFVIVLSAVLSALFFWQFSRTVFAGVWQPAALALGLIVGLAPSEGAYTGWRKTRKNKQDLTAAQLHATRLGLITSVITSMFSTFALFVATVPFVPADIQQYSEWFVFLALSVPVIAQFGIIAYYELNERETVENFENAKLDAMGFDAFVKFERARKMAIVEAAAKHLENQIAAYADIRGADEIQNLLTGNGSKSIGQQPVMAAKDTPPMTAVITSTPIVTKDLNLDNDTQRYVITLANGKRPYLSQSNYRTAEALAQSAVDMTGAPVTIHDRETGKDVVIDPKGS